MQEPGEHTVPRQISPRPHCLSLARGEIQPGILSVPLSWHNPLLSSAEEAMRSHKAHVQPLSHSVTQKALRNWPVKEISPVFIQQLLGTLNGMLLVSWAARGRAHHTKRQNNSSQNTGNGGHSVSRSFENLLRGGRRHLSQSLKKGRKAVTAGAQRLSKGPSAGGVSDVLRASENLPKRSVLAQHPIKAADRPRWSLTGTVSWRTHTSMGLSWAECGEDWGLLLAWKCQYPS